MKLACFCDETPGLRIHDSNGRGDWSAESLKARYEDDCRSLGVKSKQLDCWTYELSDTRWVYPIMEPIMEFALLGDPACVEITLEFFETDERFSFGKRLKCQAARTLKRVQLTESQQERIRRRVARMLMNGNMPHEFRDYWRLLLRVGIGTWLPQIERGIVNSDHALRRVEDLRNHVKGQRMC